jgi:hypothetical protein
MPPYSATHGGAYEGGNGGRGTIRGVYIALSFKLGITYPFYVSVSYMALN